MKEAELTALSPPALDAPTTQLMVNFTHAGEIGAVYLNQVRLPDYLPPAVRPLAMLLRVRDWVIADERQGFGLAYAVQKDWVLSMTWGKSRDAAAMELFHSLTKGFALDVEGCSWSGDDPSRNAKHTRKLWTATTLASLHKVELFFRLEAAGALVEMTDQAMSFQRGIRGGQIAVFPRSNDAETAEAWTFLEGLRKAKTRFILASHGPTQLVAVGAGADAAFFNEVLSGISVEMKSEPA